jgi:hypothetical protein
MPFGQPSSANTLSVRIRPGEDLRTFPTASQSVFTHGAFRIERDFSDNFISADTTSLRFDGYESLSSMNMSGVTESDTTFVHANELNLTDRELTSYVYFGSLKMEVGVAMNNIIDNWPYAVLANNFSQNGQNGTGITAYSYTALTAGQSGIGSQVSVFRIPYTAITNMGGIILTSGSTRQGRSLLMDTQDFVVQLSGGSSQHAIVNYSFSAGLYLEFTVMGYLFSSSTTASTTNIYIRPNDKVIANFKESLSPLEYQILYRGTWLMPNPYYDDGSTIPVTYTWPMEVDGFNPDIFGDAFDEYQNDLIDFSDRMDREKTDVLIRSVVPENYLELDSEQSVYRNIVQAYAHQFDIIKRYIDGLAFGHTVSYNGENNVPDKFLHKLTQLLGLQLPRGFNELDLFNYLSGDEDEDGNSLGYYNLQVWRRILVNIIWLFKKKGTRDALMFIFRLIGAPDCLIRLNEFVYDIERTVDASVIYDEFSGATILSTQKINADGFVEYDASVFKFQEGGKGRGDGRKYIDQWRPEFDPVIRVDNIKTQTGDTVYFMTDSIMNTKEIDCALDPAKAIECDVFTYYQLSGTCWVWGSGLPFQFENMNVPFEYAIEDCDLVNPDFITGMTLAQYVDFIYRSNVHVPSRKTAIGNHTAYHYPELRRIYMNYYLMSEPDSNSLNMRKLEAFLQLIESNFFVYSEQFIPATTILRTQGTVYRNTVYNRQRFVYRQGINAGSEFQVELPVSPPCTGLTATVTGTLEDFPTAVIAPVTVDAIIESAIMVSIVPVTVTIDVFENIAASIDVVNVEMVVGPTDEVQEYLETVEQRV